MLGEQEKNCVNHEPGGIKKKNWLFRSLSEGESSLLIFISKLKTKPIMVKFSKGLAMQLTVNFLPIRVPVVSWLFCNDVTI